MSYETIRMWIRKFGPLFANNLKKSRPTPSARWLWTYNNERPNMGIGGITPAQKLKRQLELKAAA